MTLLIIPETLMDTYRFKQMQRGLSLISPAILIKQLNSLANHGLVLKKKISGQQGHEYFPTGSRKHLLPTIKSQVSI